MRLPSARLVGRMLRDIAILCVALAFAGMACIPTVEDQPPRAARRRAPGATAQAVHGEAPVQVEIAEFPKPAPLVAAPYTAKTGNTYADRFLELWNDIHAAKNGYFSPEGVPYHAVETLLVEAPDHGHETTSEAFSYWMWLEAAYGRFGAVNLLFNNAGVAGTGGYLWENSEADWRWTLGVNVMGVAHGIRRFVPRMIAAGLDEEGGHIVNSASIAGWLCAPLLGVYNASKAAVVSASETLYHDLKLAGSRIGVSVLCPAFVPTAIFASERNRPADLANADAPTASQRLARAAGEKAVAGGKFSADDVAAQTFEAIRARRFYVFTHQQIMPAVRARLDAALEGAEPADPYAGRPGARPSPAA